MYRALGLLLMLSLSANATAPPLESRFGCLEWSEWWTQATKDSAEIQRGFQVCEAYGRYLDWTPESVPPSPYHGASS